MKILFNYNYFKPFIILKNLRKFTQKKVKSKNKT